MKVENQVCSLEQANKLKDLGVYGKSLFVHEIYSDGRLRNTGLRVLNERVFDSIPAYTVAELGAMLDDFVNHSRRNGNGTWEAKFKPVIPHAAPHRIQDAMVATFTTHKTEAEARASLLIHLLETAWLDAEKCSERLSKFINT